MPATKKKKSPARSPIHRINIKTPAGWHDTHAATPAAVIPGGTGSES